MLVGRLCLLLATLAVCCALFFHFCHVALFPLFIFNCVFPSCFHIYLFALYSSFHLFFLTKNANTLLCVLACMCAFCFVFSRVLTAVDVAWPNHLAVFAMNAYLCLVVCYHIIRLYEASARTLELFFGRVLVTFSIACPSRLAVVAMCIPVS